MPNNSTLDRCRVLEKPLTTNEFKLLQKQPAVITFCACQLLTDPQQSLQYFHLHLRSQDPNFFECPPISPYSDQAELQSVVQLCWISANLEVEAGPVHDLVPCWFEACASSTKPSSEMFCTYSSSESAIFLSSLALFTAFCSCG